MCLDVGDGFLEHVFGAGAEGHVRSTEMARTMALSASTRRVIEDPRLERRTRHAGRTVEREDAADRVAQHHRVAGTAPGCARGSHRRSRPPRPRVRLAAARAAGRTCPHRAPYLHRPIPAPLPGSPAPARSRTAPPPERGMCDEQQRRAARVARPPRHGECARNGSSRADASSTRWPRPASASPSRMELGRTDAEVPGLLGLRLAPSAARRRRGPLPGRASHSDPGPPRGGRRPRTAARVGHRQALRQRRSTGRQDAVDEPGGDLLVGEVAYAGPEVGFGKAGARSPFEHADSAPTCPSSWRACSADPSAKTMSAAAR